MQKATGIRVTYTKSDGTANVPTDVYRVWIGSQGWAGYRHRDAAFVEAVRIAGLLGLKFDQRVTDGSPATGDATQPANESLFAAAPELLATAKAIMEYVVAWNGHGAEVDAMYSAIAKAEGN